MLTHLEKTTQTGTDDQDLKLVDELRKRLRAYVIGIMQERDQALFSVWQENTSEKVEHLQEQNDSVKSQFLMINDDEVFDPTYPRSRQKSPRKSPRGRKR